MRKLVLLSAVLFSLLATGCSSTSKSIQATSFDVIKLAPLKPEQYDILADVTGAGKASLFLIGRSPLDRAKEQAMYDAISKISGADLLIAPRFEVTTLNVLGIYSEASVTVTGKAVRLKTTAR